jgi:hypothetical protein
VLRLNEEFRCPHCADWIDLDLDGDFLNELIVELWTIYSHIGKL